MSLAADLAVLTRTIGRPDVDLDAQLHAVIKAANFAIDSYLGMTLTIVVDGQPVTVTAREDVTTQIATSLLIPLGPARSGGATTTLTIYAANPGAFVDLAADLSYALGLPYAALVFDDHPAAPADGSGMTGRDTQSAVNQAIGVLIDRGSTPEAAREHLRRLCVGNGDDMRVIAGQVLRSVMSDAQRDLDGP